MILLASNRRGAFIYGTPGGLTLHRPGLLSRAADGIIAAGHGLRRAGDGVHWLGDRVVDGGFHAASLASWLAERLAR